MFNLTPLNEMKIDNKTEFKDFANAGTFDFSNCQLNYIRQTTIYCCKDHQIHGLWIIILVFVLWKFDTQVKVAYMYPPTFV